MLTDQCHDMMQPCWQAQSARLSHNPPCLGRGVEQAWLPNGMALQGEARTWLRLLFNFALFLCGAAHGKPQLKDLHEQRLVSKGDWNCCPAQVGWPGRAEVQLST